MAVVTEPLGPRGSNSSAPGINFFLAWRNLWRNKRRTWIAVSAIAFATLLIQALMSMQAGTYGPMIDGAAKFGGGHMQIQHPLYEDEPRMEHTLSYDDRLLERLRHASKTASVTPRAETYALLSNEERSEGGLVMGVVADHERDVSAFALRIREGTFLTQEDHAFVGSGIAKNLSLELGSELVLFGTAKDGTMAATVLVVGGIFETGNTALDRAFIQIPLSTFQGVFGLEDKAHRISIFANDVDDLDVAYEEMKKEVSPETRLLSWQELMPEVEQSIRLDFVSNGIIYAIFTIIVVLSIANTFVMTMFERTREFGMLMAIGVNTNTIFRTVLVEATLLWIVGSAIGMVLSGLVIGPLSVIGISGESIEEVSQQYFIEGLFPAFNTAVITIAPLAIGVGILVSASVAFLRLYRLQVVEALRDEE